MARDRLIDAFDAAALRCTSLAELRAPFEDAARDLGFDYVALLHHASFRERGARLIWIDNYPPAWKEALRAHRPARRDPVHLACRRTLTGFAWDRVGALARLTSPALNIFAQGRAFGLGDGFTVPAHVPGEPAGSCSFVVRTGKSLPGRMLLRAEQLGLHAFEAARRLAGLAGALPSPPHLSRRERQALRLVAMGKSDWEIAAILGLGHETVRQYVKRARAAYGVATRTQLAVHALRDGIVAFDEAIPP